MKSTLHFGGFFWRGNISLSLGSSAGKESTCNAEDLGWIPGLERSPGGRHGNPLQYSCLENPHGQESLSGYSPWGQKESDMTVTKHSTAHKFSKSFVTPKCFQNMGLGTSLVVQWLRIRLPV